MARLCEVCSRLDIAILMEKALRSDGDGQRHHESFRALRHSASRGCPICKVFEVAIVDTYNQSTGNIEERSVRAQPIIDQACSGFYVSAHRLLLDSHFCKLGFGCDGLRIWQKAPGSISASMSLATRSGRHPLVVGHPVAKIVDFDTCSSWIQLCATDHKDCSHIEDRVLPTRLLDVGVAIEQEPRLVELEGSKGRYVTLSHCWSRSHPLSTTVENYAQHLECIPFQSLPLTFQDAVTATRTLGYQFLWVDSLCIIQGNKGDWAHECSKMDEIYENCDLTIAGPAASDANSGFLLDRLPIEVTSCNFPDEQDSSPGKDDLTLAFPGILVSVQRQPRERNSPLTDRGWIFQERMLSPRILYFGSRQLYFECRSTEIYECCWHPAHPEFQLSSKGFARKSLFERRHHYNIDAIWHFVVETYSKCELSVITDKLPALSGIAKRLCAMSQVRYVAGLLDNPLCCSLCWRIEKPAQARKDRPYTAPSWSWASIDAPINYRAAASGRVNEMCQVEEVHIEHASPSGFGQVISGKIILRGPVSTIPVWPHRSGASLGAFPDYYPDHGSNVASLLPTHEDTLSAVEVTCILLYKANGSWRYDHPWAALALEPVQNTTFMYRRIGIVLGPIDYRDELSSEDSDDEDSSAVWNQVSESSVTII